ncbi:hypothetical protein KY362_01080 [Candidatus Woesearchaeota archaeon]|nr:hypothetical protein [Candidatus Woesearchaeota archaeon]
MKHFTLLLVILAALIAVDSAVAATLHGSIYDIELNELNNVIVEVDSAPRQRYVSKDGQYTFSLNPGEYTITANYSPDTYHEYTTRESVSIRDDGDYVFDLFLFPGFDSEVEDILQEQDVLDMEGDVIEGNGNDLGLTIAIIAVIAIIFLLIIYFFIGRRRHRKEVEELEQVEKVEKETKMLLKKELEETQTIRDKNVRKVRHRTPHKSEYQKLDEGLKVIIDIMKKEGGRTTQKELRKQIPLSEAKISLMISELEHKKIIEKVKKGRGNILILKRN